MSIAPEKLFVDQLDLYSKFDEQGVPVRYCFQFKSFNIKFFIWFFLCRLITQLVKSFRKMRSKHLRKSGRNRNDFMSLIKNKP